jgi:hypothetical protein
LTLKGQEEGKTSKMLVGDLNSSNTIYSIYKYDDKEIRYKGDSDITIVDAETTEIISFKTKGFIKCDEKVATVGLEVSNDDKDYKSEEVSDIHLEDEDNSEIVNVKTKGCITCITVYMLSVLIYAKYRYRLEGILNHIMLFTIYYPLINYLGHSDHYDNRIDL